MAAPANSDLGNSFCSAIPSPSVTSHSKGSSGKYSPVNKARFPHTVLQRSLPSQFAMPCLHYDGSRSSVSAHDPARGSRYAYRDPFYNAEASCPYPRLVLPPPKRRYVDRPNHEDDHRPRGAAVDAACSSPLNLPLVPFLSRGTDRASR